MICVCIGYRKASKKTSSRPASRTNTQDSDTVASIESDSRPPPYANLIQEDGYPMVVPDLCEMECSMPPPNINGGLINQAYAVVEFVFGGPNDSDSD
ncbi:unnamed protein product [Brassica rapa]|uniref:Uncharacterized protein n=1 Tax=Brassica campestris TaxID=3711 RepID=A0A3P5YP98_BRACM|nr:unnamed protein product [Brassica rapa]VDC65434.1 unnamed protein product [Brassica rapa]